ncbi:ABC transporter substrate-binding protein [Insulibacter thermoxylanivorax]|uniref:ABC transporter substrate-binding protein n=1 Tax=Insulibacter thermoxylanivorax TaxID=2749268 RepID=A0A916QHW3_9BACL|nr:ABC transporter substrate-binding protein [Insulibacter thermoxylanivorax]GFR38667.1 ABC transporter substrate-binding protein [Insulibacter thermoxylanivorax]
MKSIRTLFMFTAAVMMLMLAACGGGVQEMEASSQGKEVQAGLGGENKEAKGASSKRPIKVSFWHSMGGAAGEAVDKMVADFNEQQDDIFVEAVYQGSYDESLNKLRSSFGTKDGPTIVQVYEIGSRFMIDSGMIQPIQKFIDAENYDLSQLEENILAYYTFDGELYSMPFNSSNPILYYNKDMFREAGLDPERPPRTYSEVEETARILTKDGKYGVSFALYGWFMEQFHANAGAEYVDNGNGRHALAETSLVDGEAGVKTMEWWKRMIDEGTALNLGRRTSDTRAAFAAGQVAMTLDSTAGVRGYVDAVGGKFEVGTGFLPRLDGAEGGGVIIGGASLWMLNDRPEEEQQAAWEFMKFLASPEQQAYWHVSTGYFPITKAAYDLDLVKENAREFPQFVTAVEQLHASEINTATQGAVMGVFPEARQIVETAMEEIVNGAKSPQDALSAAAAEITEKIRQYNSTVN